MATVFQKCKTDEKNNNYPCEKARCGHSWTVRYREPGGRSGSQREKSFSRKGEAEDFGIKMENDKRAGIYLDPKRGQVLVKVLVYEWLDLQDIAEGTYSNYKSFLDIHLVPALGMKTVAGVEKGDFEKFVIKIHRNGLAASTVNDRMKFVTAIFQWAVEDKRIPENPASGVRIARTSSLAIDEDTIPSLDEVNLIADNISPQYRLTVFLQSGAGLRISETLAFSTTSRRDDYIRVRWQVSSKANRDDCRTRIVPLKHRIEGEYRDVPIAPFIGAEIDFHMDKWGAVPLREEGGRGLAVLFAPRERGKGTMPTATSYGYHFRKAQLKAGIVDVEGKPKYTPHDLRHFFASTALANGIPIHEVSEWLGHRSIKTTVDIYGHILPKAWQRCRDVIQLAMRPVSASELADAA